MKRHRSRVKSRNSQKPEPKRDDTHAVSRSEIGAQASQGVASRKLDWEVVGTVLLIKVLLFVFAARSFPILEGQSTGGFEGAFNIWNRWDADNYLRLAKNGYSNGDDRWLMVFYPLY